MNRFSTLFSALLISQALVAQSVAFSLHINHRLGEKNFGLGVEALNDSIPFISERMEYYLSKIEIIHDGGLVTPVEDTWLLVDASSDIRFELGEFELENVEGIRFGLGVEEEANHLDPASYPAEHPLAYQFPSMHWGWLSGYRFVCAEGFAGAALNTRWEIHALGNANYYTVSLLGAAVDEGDELVYYIDADYVKAFTNISLKLGLLEHGESGYAATLLFNMSRDVFSRAEGPMVISGLPNTDWSVAEAGDFRVWPNPSLDGRVQVSLDQPQEGEILWVLSDMTGRRVWQQTQPGTMQSLEFQLPHAGNFFLSAQLGADDQWLSPRLIQRVE